MIREVPMRVRWKRAVRDMQQARNVAGIGLAVILSLAFLLSLALMTYGLLFAVDGSEGGQSQLPASLNWLQGWRRWITFSVILGVLALSIWYQVRALRTMRHVMMLRCPECGYNLKHIKRSGNCPECGTPYDHDEEAEGPTDSTPFNE